MPMNDIIRVGQTDKTSAFRFFETRDDAERAAKALNEFAPEGSSQYHFKAVGVDKNTKEKFRKANEFLDMDYVNLDGKFVIAGYNKDYLRNEGDGVKAVIGVLNGNSNEIAFGFGAIKHFKVQDEITKENKYYIGLSDVSAPNFAIPLPDSNSKIINTVSGKQRIIAPVIARNNLGVKETINADYYSIMKDFNTITRSFSSGDGTSSAIRMSFASGFANNFTKGIPGTLMEAIGRTHQIGAYDGVRMGAKRGYNSGEFAIDKAMFSNMLNDNEWKQFEVYEDGNGKKKFTGLYSYITNMVKAEDGSIDKDRVTSVYNKFKDNVSTVSSISEKDVFEEIIRSANNGSKNNGFYKLSYGVDDVLESARYISGNGTVVNVDASSSVSKAMRANQRLHENLGLNYDLLNKTIVLKDSKKEIEEINSTLVKLYEKTDSMSESERLSVFNLKSGQLSKKLEKMISNAFNVDSFEQLKATGENSAIGQQVFGKGGIAEIISPENIKMFMLNKETFDSNQNINRQSSNIQGTLSNIFGGIYDLFGYANKGGQRHAQADAKYSKAVINFGGEDINMTNMVKTWTAGIDEMSYKKTKFRNEHAEKILETGIKEVYGGKINSSYFDQQSYMLYSYNDYSFQDSNLVTSVLAMENTGMHDQKNTLNISYGALTDKMFDEGRFSKEQVVESLKNGLKNENAYVDGTIENMLFRNLIGEERYEKHMVNRASFKEDLLAIGDNYKGINSLQNQRDEFAIASNNATEAFNQFLNKHTFAAGTNGSVDLINPDMVNAGQFKNLTGVNHAIIEGIEFTKNGIELKTKGVMTHGDSVKFMIDGVKATTSRIVHGLGVDFNGTYIPIDGMLNEKSISKKRGFTGTMLGRSLMTMAYNASVYGEEGNVEANFNAWKNTMSRNSMRDYGSGKQMDIFNLLNIDMQYDAGTGRITFVDSHYKNVLTDSSFYTRGASDSTYNKIMENVSNHFSSALGKNITSANDAEIGQLVFNTLFDSYDEYLGGINDVTRRKLADIYVEGELQTTSIVNGKAVHSKIGDSIKRGGALRLLGNIHLMAETKSRADVDALKVGRLAGIVLSEQGLSELSDAINSKIAFENKNDMEKLLALSSLSDGKYSRGGEKFKTIFKDAIDLNDPTLRYNVMGTNNTIEGYLKSSPIGKLLNYDSATNKLDGDLTARITGFDQSLLNTIKLMTSTDIAESDRTVNRMLNASFGSTLGLHFSISDKKAVVDNLKRKALGFSEFDNINGTLRMISSGVAQFDADVAKKLDGAYLDTALSYLDSFDITTNEAEIKEALGRMASLKHGAKNYNTEVDRMFAQYKNLSTDGADVVEAREYLKSMFRKNSESFKKIIYGTMGQQASLNGNANHGLLMLSQDSNLTSSEISKMLDFFNESQAYRLGNSDIEIEDFLSGYDYKKIKGMDADTWREITTRKDAISNGIIQKLLYDNGFMSRRNADINDEDSVRSLIKNFNNFIGLNSYSMRELSEIGAHGTFGFIIDKLEADEFGNIIPDDIQSSIEKIIKYNQDLKETRNTIATIESGGTERVRKLSYEMRAKLSQFKNDDEIGKKLLELTQTNIMDSKGKKIHGNQVSFLSNGMYNPELLKKMSFNSKKEYLKAIEGTDILDEIRGAFSGTAVENTFSSIMKKVYGESEFTSRAEGIFAGVSDNKQLYEYLNVVENLLKNKINGSGMYEGEFDQIHNAYSKVKSIVEKHVDATIDSTIPTYEKLNKILNAFENGTSIEDIKRDFAQDIKDLRTYEFTEVNVDGDIKRHGNRARNRIDTIIGDIFTNAKKREGELVSGIIGEMGNRNASLGEYFFKKGGKFYKSSSTSFEHSAEFSPREGSGITYYIKNHAKKLFTAGASEKKQLEEDFFKAINKVYGSHYGEEIREMYNDAIYTGTSDEIFAKQVKTRLDKLSGIVVGDQAIYERVKLNGVFGKGNISYGMLSRNPHQYIGSLRGTRYVRITEDEKTMSFLADVFGNNNTIDNVQSNLILVGKRTAMAAHGDFDGDKFQALLFGNGDFRFMGKKEGIEFTNRMRNTAKLYNLLSDYDIDRDLRTELVGKTTGVNKAIKNLVKKLYSNATTDDSVFNAIEDVYYGLKIEHMRTLDEIADENSSHALMPEFKTLFKSAQGKDKKEFMDVLAGMSGKEKAKLFLRDMTLEDVKNIDKFFDQSSITPEMAKKINKIKNSQADAVEILENMKQLIKGDKQTLKWNNLSLGESLYTAYTGIARTGVIHNELTSYREAAAVLTSEEFQGTYLKNVAQETVNKMAKNSAVFMPSSNLDELIDKLAISSKLGGAMDPYKTVELFRNTLKNTSSLINNTDGDVLDYDEFTRIGKYLRENLNDSFNYGGNGPISIQDIVRKHLFKNSQGLDNELDAISVSIARFIHDNADEGELLGLSKNVLRSDISNRKIMTGLANFNAIYSKADLDFRFAGGEDSINGFKNKVFRSATNFFYAIDRFFNSDETDDIRQNTRIRRMFNSLINKEESIFIPKIARNTGGFEEEEVAEVIAGRKTSRLDDNRVFRRVEGRQRVISKNTAEATIETTADVEETIEDVKKQADSYWDENQYLKKRVEELEFELEDVKTTPVEPIKTNGFEEEVKEAYNKIKQLEDEKKVLEAEIESKAQYQKNIINDVRASENLNNAKNKEIQYLKDQLEEMKKELAAKVQFSDNIKTDKDAIIKKLKEENKGLKDTVEGFKNSSKKVGSLFKDNDPAKPISDNLKKAASKHKKTLMKAGGAMVIGLALRMFQRSRTVINMDINDKQYEKTQGSLYRNLGNYNINTNIRSFY